MDQQKIKLPKVPRPKKDNLFKCTLQGVKLNQTIRLRLTTLVLLRQQATEAGLSISEMADQLITEASRKGIKPRF